MDVEEEFTSYVAARWARLVRSAVPLATWFVTRDQGGTKFEDAAGHVVIALARP